MTQSTDEIKELNELLSDHATSDDGRDDCCDEDYPELKTLCSSEDESTSHRSNITKPQMWAVQGDNFFACEHTVKTLPPAQYVIRETNHGEIVFCKTTTHSDELIDVSESASKEIIDSIHTFWGQEAKFRELGFLWKRGILMWGPPGSGKTTTVELITSDVIEKGGLTIFVESPHKAAVGLKTLRKIEPDRPLVVVMEDVDSIIRDYGESSLLALMDGELQIDNVIFIATTNYPERLDRRFINRPSRFDLVKKIGMPSPEMRRRFIELKYPRLSSEEREMWVEQTDEFSIAHLKELIVSVECFDVSFEETVERLRTMMECRDNSEQYLKTNKIGFVKKG